MIGISSCVGGGGGGEACGYRTAAASSDSPNLFGELLGSNDNKPQPRDVRLRDTSLSSLVVAKYVGPRQTIMSSYEREYEKPVK